MEYDAKDACQGQDPILDSTDPPGSAGLAGQWRLVDNDEVKDV